MPETDILNPTTTWESDIEDSMTPDYGFTRKRPSTLLKTKAIGGTPWTRETQNTGHVFTFGWRTRSWACVQRLKQYYEQYQDGFFTIVDWDGGGRNFVGRFTSDIAEVEVGNGTWAVEGVTFEEMPGVPMVTYPSDWNHESILFNVSNDFGDQKLATSGAWTLGAVAAPQITLGGILRTSLPTAVMNDPGTVGDWATYEYRGYGFQLWLVAGPAQGQCNVFLDGTLIQMVDCYNAVLGVQMLLSVPNAQLNIHDVQVVALGTKNAASTGTGIGWYALQAMR